MADYLVVGKKGNGKSLVCVGRIQDALLAGFPVATNLNLYLEHLVPVSDRSARVIRVPDHPSAHDLKVLGLGNPDLYLDGGNAINSEDLSNLEVRMRPGYTEEKNGVLVLDEMATWMNARSFTDKGRQSLLDWFVHSRKLGWDVYFIAQSPGQVDKQLRESLAEYQVVCRRLDKIRIPLLGVKLPRVHIATVKYGHEQDALVADRWVYRGNHLFAAYDTTQRFRSSYSRGPYSVLPPGYWYQPAPKVSPLKPLLDWFNRPPLEVEPAPKHPLIELLSRLPEDQRLKHWRRLDALGAFA